MATEVAADLAADDGAARIDMLTVVRGSIFSVGATRPDGHTPPGFNLDLTRGVRDAVRAVAGDRVAVVAQGSIVDIGQAIWAVTDGVADGVEMTRAQIADPDLVAKARAGHRERIRPCVLCNQVCMVRDNRNPIVTCVAEPSSGYETEDAPVEGSALLPVDVVVVGGGPAGLEAARVAASRGHRVRLVERGPELGGRLRTTAVLPGRDRFSLLADWLQAECERLGVDLRTDHEVDAAESAHAPHLVMATGGRAGDPTFTVDGDASVLSAADVLSSLDSVPDGAVLIWDPIGGPIGVGVAELLAAAGRTVHLVTPDYIVGNELARTGDLAPANARLAQAGVVAHKRSILRSVRAGAATLEDRFTGRCHDVDVAAVVDAGHRLPDEALCNEVRGAVGGRPERAGDCVAPRTVLEAIREGRRAALDLG